MRRSILYFVELRLLIAFPHIWPLIAALYLGSQNCRSGNAPSSASAAKPERLTEQQPQALTLKAATHGTR